MDNQYCRLKEAILDGPKGWTEDSTVNSMLRKQHKLPGVKQVRFDRINYTTSSAGSWTATACEVCRNPVSVGDVY